jgi:hypothetical protein
MPAFAGRLTRTPRLSHPDDGVGLFPLDARHLDQVFYLMLSSGSLIGSCAAPPVPPGERNMDELGGA